MNRCLYFFRFIVSLGLVFFLTSFDTSMNEVYYRDEVAVIVYHQIDDTDQSSVTITSARFRGQLSDLLNRGYHFVSLAEFKKFLSGDSIPDNAVLVTFDDGYESFVKRAVPILQQMRIPAVNFVITRHLEFPLEEGLSFLTREEIRNTAADANIFEFQCHSDSLHKWRNGKSLLTQKLVQYGIPENEEQYRMRIFQDTNRCIEKLHSLTLKPVDTYAYPYGSYNPVSVEILQQAGIRYAFTTSSGIATRRTDPMLIPRINAGSPYVQTSSVHNLILRAVRAEESKIKSGYGETSP
jgi:peptidoglycan/xylan/chitin deacetylase (PgdA/CDA1 family)